MEMHTVHVASEEKSGVKYAAMGIIFSVDDYTAKVSNAEMEIIDRFFDSLRMDTTTGNLIPVTNVTYGDLMMMVNTKNRWVYRGSVTTPPCATYVYWNVLRDVYPISYRHY